MFCKHCGAPLEEQDAYCPNCGSKTATGAPGIDPLGRVPRASVPAWEPKEKLFCELAYSGLLFWLPIAAGVKHEHAPFCAKQGFQALVLATAACMGIQIIQWMTDLLSVGLLTGAARLISVLAFMLFLFFLLFLTYRCFSAAMAIHRDQKPEELLPFLETEG